MVTRPLIILDSSPLITLALFPIHKPAIETIISVVDVVVVETVAIETTANPTHRDAKVIHELLETQRIRRLPVPTTENDAYIDAYNKVDRGERDTIRLALALSSADLILDEVAAFITATHFELKPIMLLDAVVSWVRRHMLDREAATRIVTAVSTRYSDAFVQHTKYKKYKLNKVE